MNLYFDWTPLMLETINEAVVDWQSFLRLKREEGLHTAVYRKSCALCRVFNQESHESGGSNDCEGCPVAKTMEQTECHGTPYNNADRDLSISAIEAEVHFLQMVQACGEHYKTQNLELWLNQCITCGQPLPGDK